MKSLRIGLTQGDFNGISYDLLSAVLSAPELLEICTPVLFGLPAIAERATAGRAPEDRPQFYVVPTAAAALEGRVNLVDLGRQTSADSGQQARPDSHRPANTGQPADSQPQSEARQQADAYTAHDAHQGPGEGQDSEAARPAAQRAPQAPTPTETSDTPPATAATPDGQARWQPGQQTEEALLAEAASLTAALQAWSDRQIDAIVTLPGHLDNDLDSHALCDFVQRALGGGQPAFDWIIAGRQRLLLLHPIDTSTQLGEGIASEHLLNEVHAIRHALRQDFGFLRPRIALVSTQIHLANDVRQLQSEGVDIFGPQPPAQFVDERRIDRYDAVLCLDAGDAHHQLASQMEPTMRIGYISQLSLVLTYPLLPVSYDIAGQGTADGTPLREAIYAAIDICRARHDYALATQHPLEKHWIPRGRDDFKLDLSKDD